MCDPAREIPDVEVRDARSDVPAGRLFVDAFERARELLIDTESHRIRQALIEQLGVADDGLRVLRVDAAQELLESEHLLERPRAGLGP